MPEPARIAFTYKEVAAALVKEQDLHDGLWGIYLEFGLAAGIIPSPAGDGYLPAAVIPVIKMGLQRFDEESNLTVDAAEVNPASKTRPARSKRKVES